MNLNQIRYLLAIHKYSSITKAARHLFVSAPSVSNAIKNLEEELNCSLLVRHYTGVSFTEEGKEAVKLMEEISERLQKLYLLDQNKDVALVGEILVGVSLHIKAALILPAYLQLKRDYPAITMEMIDARSHEIVNQVIQGKLNIGVIHFTNVDESTFIEKIKQNDLTFSKLYEGKMRFVVRDGHPLVAAEKLTTKAVLQFPLINYYKTDFTKAHYKYFQSYKQTATFFN